jgi:hypothetical protein
VSVAGRVVAETAGLRDETSKIRNPRCSLNKRGLAGEAIWSSSTVHDSGLKFAYIGRMRFCGLLTGIALPVQSIPRRESSGAAVMQRLTTRSLLVALDDAPKRSQNPFTPGPSSPLSQVQLITPGKVSIKLLTQLASQLRAQHHQIHLIVEAE